MALNEKEIKLKNFLLATPPDFEELEYLLKFGDYTVENLSKVGTDFVWECINECWDYFLENDIIRTEELIPNLHSTYLCEILSLLLRYGLDPNAIYEEENIMDNLKYLDNGYQAADALVLLFEHGGDPNLICDGFSIFDEIDFDVLFDAAEQQDRQRYSSMVHCWMVFLAFGGRLSNGNSAVEIFHGFDLSMLKDHRRFYFGITKGETWPDIHIFDKKDLWEVVRA